MSRIISKRGIPVVDAARPVLHPALPLLRLLLGTVQCLRPLQTVVGLPDRNRQQFAGSHRLQGMARACPLTHLLCPLPRQLFDHLQR